MGDSEIEEGEVLEEVELPSKQKRTREAKKKCKYWAQGTCHKGQDCTYLHDLKDELCKYFLNGTCVKGEECVYSHDPSKFPCKYFHGVGFCTAGDACRFSHARIPPDQINRFIRENEAFLVQVQNTRGFTNMQDYFVKYMSEKGGLLPTPVAMWNMPPRPPSPDICSRLNASGIIKSKNISLPPTGSTQYRPQNTTILKKQKLN